MNGLVFSQDNLFPNVVSSVRFEVLVGKASDAFKKQSYTRFQIQACAFDGRDWKFGTIQCSMVQFNFSLLCKILYYLACSACKNTRECL